MSQTRKPHPMTLERLAFITVLVISRMIDSIRLDSTASRFTNGRMSRCGLGSRRPSPASRPMARSASERARASVDDQTSAGGSASGTNARYPPGQRTRRPEARGAGIAIIGFDNNRDHYYRNRSHSKIAFGRR